MHRKVRIFTIPIISLFTVLAIIVSGACISGCKNNDASYNPKYSSSTPDTTTPGTTTPDTTTPTTTAPALAWDAPTTYSDGSPLLDLKEYRIYFSNSSGPYSTGNFYTVSAQTTSIKAKDVISQGTGTYYFVITAVDSTNRESNPSNEVSRYVN
jgi:hypothetical protein